MSEHDGIIRRVHECHCIRCERPYLGLSDNLEKARDELKRDGWRLVLGRWHCAICVEVIRS